MPFVTPRNHAEELLIFAARTDRCWALQEDGSLVENAHAPGSPLLQLLGYFIGLYSM
jgi:hypothetical protein